MELFLQGGGGRDHLGDGRAPSALVEAHGAEHRAVKLVHDRVARRPPPGMRAALNGGTRLRHVLAAGASTGECVKKSFDCNYCDQDRYYSTAKLWTDTLTTLLAALSAFRDYRNNQLFATEIGMLAVMGRRIRESVAFIPSVQSWWTRTSTSVTTDLTKIFDVFRLIVTDDAVNPTGILWENILTKPPPPPKANVSLDDVQTNLAFGMTLLIMVLIIAKEKMKQSTTIRNIATSIKEGQEMWIRLLGGYFRMLDANRKWKGEAGKEFNNFGIYVFKAATDVLQGECDPPARISQPKSLQDGKKQWQLRITWDGSGNPN